MPEHARAYMPHPCFQVLPRYYERLASLLRDAVRCVLYRGGTALRPLQCLAPPLLAGYCQLNNLLELVVFLGA
jgi:hypothetical protein